jgi:PAS domain S-box-containing protein
MTDHHLNRKLGEMIRAQRHGLAERIVSCQYEQQAEQWVPYGEEGKLKSIRDAGYHLAYLSDSIRASNPSLFLDYVAWAKVLFANRGFPSDVMQATLQCTDKVLRDTLPKDLMLVAGEYIEAALQRIRAAPSTVPSVLTADAPLAQLASEYLQALLRGERAIASGLILQAVESGVGVKDIYLHVFQPTQYEIGRFWQMNKITVAQEHYCTAATQFVMSQLYPQILNTKKTGQKLVAACVGDELHELGVRMVADLFELEGWQTYYLGANTPTASILQTLKERKPDLLAVSATMTYHLPSVVELIESVRASNGIRDIPILVGGYPFNVAPDLWRQVGADGYARDAQEAVRTGKRLVEAEPRSRRGAPAAEASSDLAAPIEATGGDAAPKINLYDELTRLNNELTNLRRELEQRVLERTTELRASEARFRTLFEQASVGILLVDRDGSVLQSNQTLQEMLGLSSEDLPGRPLAEFLPSPSDASGVMELHRELMAGQRDHFEIEQGHVNKGAQPCWLHVTASLVRDEDLSPWFALYMLEDITERRQTQAALLQAERLAIAGKLAASLTHEINNPLQSVIGFLALADESAKAGKDAGRYLEIALEELRRVARIVGRLRNLQRPSRLEEKRPTSIPALLDKVISLTSKTCEEHGVECTLAKDPDLPPVALVPDRMQQVFLNLVLNALDAMPDGGTLRVSTSRTHQPSGVSVSFHDSGEGIASEALAHLFQPFYSTKSDGLGLGLLISQDIVKQHGGRIDTDSTVGKGTTFTVWLPA